MNYYEHHIGDYAEATAHLSILEDGAYSRLLRKCYATERPLPSDVDRVQRLVGARTDDERAAVEAVLHEFFELREDGWHQERCDKAIAAYLAGEPEREIKKTNETARQHRHRAERAELFKALHEAGQFPAWNTPISEVRALAVNLQSAPVTSVTAPVTPDMQPVTGAATSTVTEPATPATATQYPFPIPQSPSPISQHPLPVVEKKKRQSRLPLDFAPNEAGLTAAVGLSVEVEIEIEAFKNYHTAKDSLMADWQAAWRTWCGNARKFGRPAAGRPARGPMSDAERNVANEQSDAEAKRLLFGNKTTGEVIDA